MAPKHELVLAKLVLNSKKSGIDTIVSYPVELLEQTMDFSYAATMNNLRRLEVMGAIVLEKRGMGNSIVSARILQTKLGPALHELDEETRLLKSLWRHKRTSQSDPQKKAVHQVFFNSVQRESGINQPTFYILLNEFEKSGWISLHRKTRNNKILYLTVNESFPSENC